MAETIQYVEIMMDSLNKKLALLDSIIEYNHKLEEVIAEPDMDLECFRELMDQKDVCVSQINQLDTGFQSVFDKVKEALDGDRSQYREQIRTMQQQIRDITDRVVIIEEAEAKNRLVIEGQFAKMRRDAQAAKKGMNVAQNYYKNMSMMNVVEAQFVDKKN